MKKEIKDTDGQSNQTQSRKEQGILRGILFKGISEAKCAICHRTFPTDIMVAAHIKPRSKGGKNELNNMQLTCELCNSKKADNHNNLNYYIFKIKKIFKNFLNKIKIKQILK